MIALMVLNRVPTNADATTVSLEMESAVGISTNV